jgi:hypothetical protein
VNCVAHHQRLLTRVWIIWSDYPVHCSSRGPEHGVSSDPHPSEHEESLTPGSMSKIAHHYPGAPESSRSKTPVSTLVPWDEILPDSTIGGADHTEDIHTSSSLLFPCRFDSNLHYWSLSQWTGYIFVEKEGCTTASQGKVGNYTSVRTANVPNQKHSCPTSPTCILPYFDILIYSHYISFHLSS